MKPFKYILTFGVFLFILINCGNPATKNINTNTKEEPVTIKNDSLEYEIIIMDVGFNFHLNSIARPRNFYSQTFLENRNRQYVIIWNQRAQNPQQFNPNIYQNVVDYNPNIDYGYEVNYLLFNYFEFAQRKYRMVLR